MWNRTRREGVGSAPERASFRIAFSKNHQRKPARSGRRARGISEDEVKDVQELAQVMSEI